MAILCFGVFAGAMAFNAIPTTDEAPQPSHGMLWNAFQYGLPLLIGGICLTGQRWACMTAIIYGTVGLALDLATLVQNLTEETGSLTFVAIILTTALLNFFLIVLGGKFLLTESGLKV
jgi:hypothetical protein